MKHEDYLKRTYLTKEELLAVAWGTLLDDPPEGGFAALPAPPLLMFDRVTQIERAGSRGKIVAEQDVQLDAWFFQCHFRNDPVQPGCLGLDAVWQLIGLYCGLRGAAGTGRALGVGEVEFMGQIRPHNRVVRYEIEIRRVTEFKTNASTVAIGNAKVFVDDEWIYTINDAKAGVFRNLAYSNYPHRDDRGVGGRLSL